MIEWLFKFLKCYRTYSGHLSFSPVVNRCNLKWK